jgi:tetratricopeptide (TPR) repeat protein
MIFLLSVLPVLGLWPFAFQVYSTVADRYVYLAMLGPALAMAWFLKCYSGHVSAIGASILIVAWSVISFVQVGYWHDSQSFYRHAIAVNQQSQLAHNNLGVILMDLGDKVDAMNQFKIVVQLSPQQISAYRYIADATGELGDWRGAADWSRRLLDEARRQHLDMEALHQWRSGICLHWGDDAAIHREPDAKVAYEQAIQESQEALQLKPDDAMAKKNLWAAQNGLRSLGADHHT